jgi:hypothetical protein
MFWIFQTEGQTFRIKEGRGCNGPFQKFCDKPLRSVRIRGRIVEGTAQDECTGQLPVIEVFGIRSRRPTPEQPKQNEGALTATIEGPLLISCRPGIFGQDTGALP